MTQIIFIELNHEISLLEEKKSDLERSRDLVLEQSRKVVEGMRLYLDTKQELDKHKISITQDIPKFATTVKSIAEYGYDPERVIAEFEDNHYLEDKHRVLKIAADEKQKSLVKLHQQDASLREAISLHSHNLSLLNELVL